MPAILCYHEGKYNFYTTVCDDFYYEKGVPLDEILQYVKEERGNDGVARIKASLDRVHATGTSSRICSSLKDVIALNRAGENNTTLSFEECIAKFFS